MCTFLCIGIYEMVCVGNQAMLEVPLGCCRGDFRVVGVM